MKILGTTLAFILLTGGAVQAHVTMIVEDGQRCMTSNPELTDTTITDQLLTDTLTNSVLVSGVTMTGIPLRPGTAEYYDASTERGYSRDRASGWNVEGIGGLIMNAQNGHVDGSGLCHYHGISSAVTGDLDGTLFGYAADGFAILYAGEQAQSSWQLKSGERRLVQAARMMAPMCRITNT